MAYKLILGFVKIHCGGTICGRPLKIVGGSFDCWGREVLENILGEILWGIVKSLNGITA